MTDSPRQETTLQEPQGERLESERLERAEILRKYSGLVNDVDFDQVELGLKEANIFSILGIQRREIRHSNFLAWMFDPNGSHGIGNAFLRRFLRDISLESPKQGQPSLDIADTSPKTAEIRREWRNIDILVILDKHVICIENKVDSSDHENQLSKYKNVVQSQFRKSAVFVYLTPDGRPPNDKGQHQHYTNYSYDKIVAHAERLLLLHERTLPSNIKTYIKDYTLNIRRNLMQQDHLNELAQKLYANHKETLDFIFANRPDVVSQVRDYFSAKVRNEGFVEGSRSRAFVRFTTQELNSLLLRQGNGSGGWQMREQFLFEFEFSDRSNNQLIALLKTGVHPSGNQEIRRILIEITGSPPVDIPSSSRFSVRTKHTFTVLSDITGGIDDNLMNNFFETEWPRILDIVNDVSQSILDRSEEIKSIYGSSPPG